MFDLPHPCYLDHNQEGRSKPLNQDYYGGNRKCKLDLIDLEHLSRIRRNILSVMTFRFFSLIFILLLFSK